MKRLAKTAAALLLCLALTASGVSFPEERTEAVVEVIAGASLLEILGEFVISFGVTYLATEQIGDVWADFTDYVNGTGAKKYKDLEENQERLSPGGDSPEGGGAYVAVMDWDWITFSRDFWSDWIAENFGEHGTARFSSSSRIHYKYVTGGLVDMVTFGSYQANGDIETLFADSENYPFVGGNGTMQVSYYKPDHAGDPNYYTSFYGRFLTQPVADGGIPVLRIWEQDGARYGVEAYLTDRAKVFSASTSKVGGNCVEQATVSKGVAGTQTGVCKSMGPLYPYLDCLHGIYDSVPGSMVLDGTVADGQYYYWDGSRLYLRGFDAAAGEFVDSPAQNGYVYTDEGAYFSLHDLYPDEDMAQFIDSRLQSLEDYLRTLSPEELPRVTYDELQNLWSEIEGLKNPYIQEYPAPQPSTGEVPSSYPQELDDLYRKYAVEHNPEADPGTNPGTNPDANPETNPEANPETNPETNPEDEDEESKKKEGYGKTDFGLNLIDFFPFCLPKDAYLLVKALDADPEAPKFKWNVPSLGNGGEKKDNIVEVDLSGFDDVAGVVRLLEKLAFVFGLVMFSRRIVKGG